MSLRRSFRRVGALWLLLAWAFVHASPAGAQVWIRDQIRVNTRAGPGLEFKITELLTSGDEVTRLTSNDEWVKVRAASGKDGWVPKGYITTDPPASVALPGVQASLSLATAKVDELEQKLAAQAEAVGELEALRERNEQLDAELTELTWSSGWKTMATGAMIVVLGMVIGLLIPRGSMTRSRLKF